MHLGDNLTQTELKIPLNVVTATDKKLADRGHIPWDHAGGLVEIGIVSEKDGVQVPTPIAFKVALLRLVPSSDPKNPGLYAVSTTGYVPVGDLAVLNVGPGHLYTVVEPEGIELPATVDRIRVVIGRV